jgi:hypothetical protein
MPHFWLCYRDPKQRFNVTIIEARSLIHARLKATLAGENGGMVFTEGHMFSAEMMQLVQPRRVLSADEAMELLTQLGPKPPGHRRGTKE